MTAFRDRDGALRERVRTLTENLADDLAAIDPLVLAHAPEDVRATLVAARAALDEATAVDALETTALVEIEQRLEALAAPVGAQRARSADRRAELLTLDHPFVVPAPHRFTPTTFGRGSALGAAVTGQLDVDLTRALSWATDVSLTWLLDPRRRRGLFDFLFGDRTAAVGVSFRSGDVPLHLLCETRTKNADSTHWFVMTSAVPRAFGSASYRFFPEHGVHLPKSLGKSLGSLAHFDVPGILVGEGTAHLLLGFDVDARMLSLMRDVLLALRALPPTTSLRDLFDDARSLAHGD